MSQIMLIAAEKPLPLCDYQETRTHQVRVGGQSLSMTLTEGFKIEEHYYYRDAVAALGFPMRPCRYELSMTCVERDLWLLQDYLERHMAPGDRAELWSVRTDAEDRKIYWQQRWLKKLDMAALGLLFGERQVCLTVER